MIRDAKFITGKDGHIEVDHVIEIPDMYHSVPEFDEALAAMVAKIRTLGATPEIVVRAAKEMIDTCPRRLESCVTDDLVFITDYITEALWSHFREDPDDETTGNYQLMIVSKDGILVATIDDIDQFDLTKPIAQADVIGRIRDALKLGKGFEVNKNRTYPASDKDI